MKTLGLTWILSRSAHLHFRSRGSSYLGPTSENAPRTTWVSPAGLSGSGRSRGNTCTARRGQGLRGDPVLPHGPAPHTPAPESGLQVLTRSPSRILPT